MKLKIMNYTYYNNKSENKNYNAPILIFLCRDENRNFHMVFVCDKENLAPEMYIPFEEKFIAESEEIITKIEDSPASNYGEKVVRLETTFPWEVKKLRKNFTHTYLSDIKWEKMCVEKMGLQTPYIKVPDDFNERWLKVEDVEELPDDEHFYVPIRWIGWDIETNVEIIWPTFNGWQDAEKCEIISITAYDSYDKVYDIFFWHKDVINGRVLLWKNWERKGQYYVPALKKIREYARKNDVYIHEFNNEVDMLKGYFDYYASKRPDAQFGFNSEGGYRISTRKGLSRKYWFDGFDMPYLYQRCKKLGLLEDIKKMSPLPKFVNGVKWRADGDRHSVQIEGVCQIDFIFTNEIFQYHKKFDEFREGNLQGYMSYFLGFGKVEHQEQIWEMWKNKTESDYDPTNPELVGVKKRRNYVMEMFEDGKKMEQI